MPQLKPVPGQIVLTHREMVLLKRSTASRLTITETDQEAMVRSLFSTLNETRHGAPAGEVRRSSNGSLAVREQQADGALGWNVTYLDDSDEAALRDGGHDEIRKWDCIHHESWWNRLTEKDFATEP